MRNVFKTEKARSLSKTINSDNMHINHLLFWGMFGLTAELFFTALVGFISKKNYNLMNIIKIFTLILILVFILLILDFA